MHVEKKKERDRIIQSVFPHWLNIHFRRSVFIFNSFAFSPKIQILLQYIYKPLPFTSSGEMCYHVTSIPDSPHTPSEQSLADLPLIRNLANPSLSINLIPLASFINPDIQSLNPQGSLVWSLPRLRPCAAVAPEGASGFTAPCLSGLLALHIVSRRRRLFLGSQGSLSLLSTQGISSLPSPLLLTLGFGRQALVPSLSWASRVPDCRGPSFPRFLCGPVLSGQLALLSFAH